MPILQFMPWCRVEKSYSVGATELLPFQVNVPIKGLDEPTSEAVAKILAIYRDLEGRPVEKAGLIRFGERSLIEDMTDDDLEVSREIADLICFAGLAARGYFRPGPYCNADCFTLYTQKFKPGSDFSALSSRRRDGRTLDGRYLARTVISIPVHCSTIREIVIDEPLLAALITAREHLSNDEWGSWQSSVSCFNQANTDNDSVRQQVEWVLLCGAFQHLLDARSDAKDVGEKFSTAFAPSSALLGQDSQRKSERWTERDRPLRYEWMKEFYRIRGDFAHGKTLSRQPMSWTPEEHLVLAAIAFPLLVRLLLQKGSFYTPTLEDRAQIDSFEKLADADFLKTPENQESSLDSVWSRLLQKASIRAAALQAMETLKSQGLIALQPEPSPGGGRGE